MTQAPVIHWFRRDLRLQDNIALHQACENGSPVIPLFIIDTGLINSQYVGAVRMQFLLNALHSLEKSLAKFDTHLVIRHGEPQNILPQFIEQTQAQALYFNRDYSPYAQRRDSEIENALTIPVHICDDAVLLSPGSVLKDDGDPYIVYTPFWKKWKVQNKPAVSKYEYRNADFTDTSKITHAGIPTPQELGFEDIAIEADASEYIAHDMLRKFTDANIQHYSKRRNQLPINPFSNKQEQSTSFLSPYLRLGLLSPRQAYWAARKAYHAASGKAQQKSIETWVSELAWREFYIHILHFFPHVRARNFNSTYDTLGWRDAPDELQAWQDGMTGYPIVDAAMRQLQSIGWMPNRARMIVASFLTKDLLIHWRHGEQHFMQHLIDGDPAANNGGWQWAAGTGTDAQPYFRIFNPVSQSKQHATPAYLRHWLPELASVPDEHIHEPWLMNNPPQAYPAPMVDHKMARKRTIAAFKAAQGD